MPLVSGNFTEYLLSRADVKPAWHDFTHHEFVRQMGDGTLPLEWFKYYMIQDYIYLVSLGIVALTSAFTDRRKDPLCSRKRFGWIQDQVTRWSCESSSPSMHSTQPADVRL